MAHDDAVSQAIPARLMDVHVRGIDPEVWRALRMEAVKRGLSVAKLIEELWRESMDRPTAAR